MFKNIFSFAPPGILVLIFTDLSVIAIYNGLLLVTARVCGNVFILLVCVCVCVCLSVGAITFEWLDIETKFLVWRYILTISRSSSSTKVTGSKSLIK